MDRLDAMAILVAVVDAGSLTAASRRLHMPLATVSRKLTDLETRIGARLLDRSKRRAALTDAGQSYVAACRRILEDVSEAERSAAGEYSLPKGGLVITAPVVLGRLHVLPVVTAFLRAYPDIDIRLILADRLINILDDHVDLAVRIGELPDSSFKRLRLGAMRRVVCGAPSYFEARGRPERPEDLASHDCIAFEGMEAADAWSFPMPGSSMPVAIRPRLAVNTAEAAIDAAIAGIGITRVLAYQAAAATHAGALAIALRGFEPPPWPVNLVHQGQRLLPLKLRAFLDFAAPRLKASLAKDAVPAG